MAVAWTIEKQPVKELVRVGTLVLRRIDLAKGCEDMGTRKPLSEKGALSVIAWCDENLTMFVRWRTFGGLLYYC